MEGNWTEGRRHWQNKRCWFLQQRGKKSEELTMSQGGEKLEWWSLRIWSLSKGGNLKKILCKKLWNFMFKFWEYLVLTSYYDSAFYVLGNFGNFGLVLVCVGSGGFFFSGFIHLFLCSCFSFKLSINDPTDFFWWNTDKIFSNVTYLWSFILPFPWPAKQT